MTQTPDGRQEHKMENKQTCQCGHHIGDHTADESNGIRWTCEAEGCRCRKFSTVPAPTPATCSICGHRDPQRGCNCSCGCDSELPPLPDAPGEAPLDIVIFCPNCHAQHVDKADPDNCEDCGFPEEAHSPTNRKEVFEPCDKFNPWLNPPHKSHRCHNCNFVFRPRRRADERCTRNRD